MHRTVWGNGLDIPLVLGHVLLHLQVEIRHEGPVLLVDDVVGDHQEEHAGTHQGEAEDQDLLSLRALNSEPIFRRENSYIT